jgi:mRNA interferase MazF
MNRGEIWTSSGGNDYASKARPVVIVQDDRWNQTNSVIVCPFTTDQSVAPIFRLAVEPNERNGLRLPCRIMFDKITSIPKIKLRSRVGRLDDAEMLRLNQALIVMLGLAISPRTQRSTETSE